MLRSTQPSRHRLMATILSLVFVLAAVLGNVTPAAALAAWPTVRNGDSGPNVKTVQYLLRQRGSTITADGAFGPATESAVKSFQSANGLAADGIVGADTWPKLVVTVDVGSQGEAVKGLQVQLNKHGYTSVAVDGVYGNATGSAVTDFKSKRGLTGGTTVGATTWQELTGSNPSSGTWRTALASSYGPGLWYNKTACGQILYPSTIGVAHKTMACGTRLKFQGKNGVVVAATVIDRGPYVGDREFDLTEATVKQMGYASTSDFGVRTVYWNYN
jgi:peptidoglycan hydrolase-like protein with peptidoglycan-binding domain